MERTLGKSTLWSGTNLRYDGGKMVDGLQRQSHALVENDAEQHNGELCQEANNEPFAGVHNKNFNKNPQFALLGTNDSTNWQSNETWIDQSQNAKAVQANVLWQGISVNHAPAGWVGGGGPPLVNDADQSNRKLEQDANNEPFAWVGNKNVNFNPQFTLLGSNSSTNTQSNSTSIDQSQNVKAAQVNLAGQSIHVGPPIDPVNDADQSNGKLNQHANNEPKAFVHNDNVNFNPQFTLVGGNSPRTPNRTARRSTRARTRERSSSTAFCRRSVWAELTLGSGPARSGRSNGDHPVDSPGPTGPSIRRSRAWVWDLPSRTCAG